MSDIKPGDRVRCTLGDNVLVGVVAACHGLGSLTLLVGKSLVDIDPLWTVEVLGPDNFPREPGFYEVTWEDGEVSPCNPFEVGPGGHLRSTYGDDYKSTWFAPRGAHRRATWERLPDPLPPEPPVGAVLRDRDGDAWQRSGDKWHMSDLAVTWAAVQKYAPLTRLVPAPDPDDKQQVEALTEVLTRVHTSVHLSDVARAVLTFLRDGGAR